MYGLCAEAVSLALADAGLRKQDIDGLITAGGDVPPASMAEYLGIRPHFATGVTMMGASGATATAVAASAIAAGMCNYVLIVVGQGREPGAPFGGGPRGPGSVGTEWEFPYGPAVAANTGYGLIYQRHMHEYGTKPEQMAKLAVDERFNALPNPNAVFRGQPITIEDVLNSRFINAPLHLLESVMPCAGAAACVVTSAERALALPNRSVYVLGAGIEQANGAIWQTPRITESPAAGSTRRAFAMAGYSPRDMEFAEFYD